MARVNNIKPASKCRYNPEIDLTGAQEDFCQQYVGKAKHNASEAYRIAYPKSRKWKKDKAVHEQASVLMALPKVYQRIAELEAETAKRNEITRDKVLQDLENVRKLSRDAKQFGPAIKCSELQGKDIGMFVERHKVETDVTVNVVTYGDKDGKKV